MPEHREFNGSGCFESRVSSRRPINLKSGRPLGPLVLPRFEDLECVPQCVDPDPVPTEFEKDPEEDWAACRSLPSHVIRAIV